MNSTGNTSIANHDWIMSKVVNKMVTHHVLNKIYIINGELCPETYPLFEPWNEVEVRLTIPGEQLGTLQEYHLQVTKNSYFHTIDKQNILMTK